MINDRLEAEFAAQVAILPNCPDFDFLSKTLISYQTDFDFLSKTANNWHFNP